VVTRVKWQKWPILEFSRADEDVTPEQFERASRMEATPKVVTSFHVLILRALAEQGEKK
jgi:hypothetical protein